MLRLGKSSTNGVSITCLDSQRVIKNREPRCVKKAWGNRKTRPLLQFKKTLLHLDTIIKYLQKQYLKKTLLPLKAFDQHPTAASSHPSHAGIEGLRRGRRSYSPSSIC